MWAEERIDRKWFFPVRMDRSARLARGRTDMLETGPRQEAGGLFLRVDAIPFRRVSKCPKEVDRDKGGYLETSLGVSRGIP